MQSFHNSLCFVLPSSILRIPRLCLTDVYASKIAFLHHTQVSSPAPQNLRTSYVQIRLSQTLLICLVAPPPYSCLLIMWDADIATKLAT